MHPVAIFGPVLSHDLSTSIVPILTLITAGYEQMANISFSLAGVRDVRRHIRIRAMTHPAAAGERFIACCDGGPITMREAAVILRDWTRVADVIKAPIIGDVRRPSNHKAKTLLGWRPRPIDEAAAGDARARPHRPSPGSVIAAQTVVLIGSMLSTNERLTAKSIDLKPFSLRSSRRGRWSGG